MNTQQRYKPIACHLYDHFEIACLHRYDISLTLRDGSTCVGQAIDTAVEDGQEFLLLLSNDQAKRIRLDTIERMDVTSEPREFDKVVLS